MAAPAYRFTIFDLDSCLAVADALQANGGLLSSAELAMHLGYKSDNNGSFNTKLANARLFGLIEGPSSSMSPSERAIRILHPDYPEDGLRARLEAFESVPLYKAVLDQYNGQPLPDETGLRNALTTRWQISADKAPTVLARLLDSAEQAGLFKTAGNRSKLIRPTIGSAGSGANFLDDPAPAPVPVVTVAGVSGAHVGVRASKLIDGVLDMLPDDQTWDEASLAHWLRFFEDALRLCYRLPRDEPVATARPRDRSGPDT